MSVEIRRSACVTVEVAVSKITGHLLLRVESEGAEQLWAGDIQELVVDLGREDLLVLRPGRPVERRARDD